MHVIVDTREPLDKISFLRTAYPKITFERSKLDEGDFESEKVLVERKTISDLYGSIVGTKSKKGRFEDQVLRMSCHEKIILLMITGDIYDYMTYMRSRGVEINPQVIYGAIGSVSCRENIHVWWIEEEYNALLAMILFMQKVEDGAYKIPSKRDPDILLARYFKLTPTQWKCVKKEYASLVELSEATEKELTKINGIGKIKARGIKDLVTGKLV